VQIRQAQSQLEVKKLEFIKLTGEAPSAALKPLTRSPVMHAPQPLNPETWMNAAREQSYKVLAQRANVQLAKASIDRVKAGFYPSVSLVASRQQSYGSNYFTDNERTDSLGVQLSMSLFDGGNTRTLTAQAVSQTERATNELRSVQEDAAIGAGQAYWGVVNGMEQVKAMELAVEAAELALQGTRLGIKANIKTYADELNAVQLLFATRRDLQKERYTYLLSRTQLLWSAGLSEKDLAELLMSLLDDNLPNVLSLGSN
jgi:outer membrane protein